MSALIDMTGLRVGRLTILGRGEDHVLRNGKRRPQWNCLCDCGTRVLVGGQNLRAGARAGRTNYSCGCWRRDQMASVGRQNWKGDSVSYSAAHRRVRKARGRASEHPCVDCSASAEEWSYCYSDPNELTEAGRRRGKAVVLRYSGDPAHYAPRCRPCHGKFDRDNNE